MIVITQIDMLMIQQSLAMGKFLQIISEVLQTSPSIVQQLCNRINLSINSNNMVVIPFTMKRNIKGHKKPTLFSKLIQLTSTLDWLNKEINKPYRASGHAEAHLGKLVDKIKVLYWIYTMVKRSIVTYATKIRWPRVKLKTSKAELSKVQTMACLGITGAMQTTPTAANKGLPPLYQRLRKSFISALGSIQQYTKHRCMPFRHA